MSTAADLAIYAGARAYRHIQSNGLQAKDIGKLIGSAGGPKALALTGLDQYLFGDWLTTSRQPLWLFGSSIAAWRFACAAQPEPRAAFEHFAQLYVECSLPARASTSDTTRATHDMLRSLIGSAAEQSAIIDHPRYRFAISIARCKGWTCSDNHRQLSLALGACLLGNYLHSSIPRLFFERVIVHDPRAPLPVHEMHKEQASYAALEQGNLFDTLAATTAIPLAIQAVSAASNWPSGMYRDGGLVDYNFCTLGLTGPGFTLFPHFGQTISANWFDKYLPRWQKARRPHMLDDLIMISPTPRFLDRLEGRRIPDRSDYKRLSDPERRRNWQNAVAQSQRLGDQFVQWVDQDKLAQITQPLIFP